MIHHMIYKNLNLHPQDAVMLTMYLEVYICFIKPFYSYLSSL